MVETWQELSVLKHNQWCKLRDMNTTRIRIVQFDDIWHMGYQFIDNKKDTFIVAGIFDEKEWRCVPLLKEKFPEYYL